MCETIIKISAGVWLTETSMLTTVGISFDSLHLCNHNKGGRFHWCITSLYVRNSGGEADWAVNILGCVNSVPLHLSMPNQSDTDLPDTQVL